LGWVCEHARITCRLLDAWAKWMEAGRRLAGPAFRDRVGLGRREDQSRPVGEDGRPPLAFGHHRREWKWLLEKKTGRVFPTLARRFLCFWLRCIRSAAVGSIAPATGWAPILGGLVLWLALRAWGWELILPETLQGWALVGFACLGSAWLFIFIIRTIFWEAFAQHFTAETTIATQRSEIADLHSEITIPIPDLVTRFAKNSGNIY
jgi:hypothetical protein